MQRGDPGVEEVLPEDCRYLVGKVVTQVGFSEPYDEGIKFTFEDGSVLNIGYAGCEGLILLKKPETSGPSMLTRVLDLLTRVGKMGEETVMFKEMTSMGAAARALKAELNGSPQ